MKKLLFVITAVATQSAFANRESGGFLKASAIYVSFESLESASFGEMKIDDVSFDATTKYIADAQASGLVDQHSFSRDVFTSSKVVCVMFHEKKQHDPMSAELVRIISESILKDRLDLGLVRTRVFAGSDCMNFARATEIAL